MPIARNTFSQVGDAQDDRGQNGYSLEIEGIINNSSPPISCCDRGCPQSSIDLGGCRPGETASECPVAEQTKTVSSISVRAAADGILLIFAVALQMNVALADLTVPTSILKE
jgi:hypothetical protein